MASENDLLSRIEGLEIRFEEITSLITAPDIIADQKRFMKLSKEYRDLERILAKGKEYRNLLGNIEEGRETLETESDPELRTMAREMMNEAEERIPSLEEEIKLLLIPADPEDEKNVVMEIRGGTGGDEAAIFAGDLYKMYVRYCEGRGWKCEVTSVSEGTAGGYKEIIFSVTGEGVYGILKYESGVHRVQRVPETEGSGRIHTSAVTVAVLPEAEETEIVIKQEDLRIDVMRAGGPGGQCVNTTDSAVRLTHYPTGIVIYSQTEKSQLQNKEKAFRLLRSKLYALELERRQAETAEARRAQIGTGDRSEKIRTYNFPQGRVTDHRIKLTLYSIDRVMDGDLDEILDALLHASRAAELAGTADSESAGKENGNSL